MHGPTTSLSAWLLVSLCAASGAYCLGRVSRADRGVAAGDAVMGLGMAVMAAPLPMGGAVSWALAAVFALAGLHALWLLRGGAHHAHHLVGAAAMVYMSVPALAGSGAGHGQGHGGAAGGVPLLTGALLWYFAGYVLVGGVRLVGAGTIAHRPPGGMGGAGGADGTDELTRACRLAMGMGMFAMLLSW
ncbi:DUF5134 domain-containing protein [Streptomyces bambusae]|uniref:DUF5134 domain-containing protein n=1 Tax=Streptomyces bambusae TaxID=1550616 RepID=A0ABS6Z7S7_9ACTN|nr:DUF5134 domain-containing protein [Streptomyces bambusae]MBW5483802.1 DUF5134 domain-containing protein [Streptomyces bambusae]